MDIVERLRRMSDMTTTDNDLTDIAKAAYEIEFLRKERDRFREALQKIYDDDSPEYIPEIMIKHLYSHYTIARDALNGEEE